MKDYSEHCLISNIQHYCIHDGDGLRTTVFLKGCPLRCYWCANPENQSYKPELMYYENKCVKCFYCAAACKTGALEVKDGQLVYHKEKCILCGQCAGECLKEAIKISGEEKSAGEVAGECLKDRMFYDRSGGGVTVSGGEPLSFGKFCQTLADICSAEGVGVTYETCGCGSFDTLSKYAEKASMFFFDVKHHDPGKHREATGVTNELILENLRKLTDMFGNVVVRIPVVPGFNDSDEDMKKLAHVIKEHIGSKGIKYVELLPYHNFGETKYAALRKTYVLENHPRMEKSHVMKYIPYFEKEDLICVVN